MADEFRFDETFLPVPPAVADADPAEAMTRLLKRVGRLDRSLADERLSALADLGEVLIDVASLSDDITRIIERWGVITDARQAGLVRGVVALGKKLMNILKHHQVEAIETIGQPLDPETSDVVGTEPQKGVPVGTVLREEQIGYTWAHGLLRRAKVVLSAEAEAAAPAESEEEVEKESEEGADTEEETKGAPHAHGDTTFHLGVLLGIEEPDSVQSDDVEATRDPNAPSIEEESDGGDTADVDATVDPGPSDDPDATADPGA